MPRRAVVRRVAGFSLLGLLGTAALVPPAGHGPPSGILAGALHGPAAWLPLALGVWAAGAVLGVALAMARRMPVRSAPSQRPAQVAWLVAAVAAASTTFVAVRAFGGAPVHVDAVVQAFQANLLRGGAAAAPAPSLPEFFVTLNTRIAEGRWVGQFPPGFPALLALTPPGASRALIHAGVAALLACAVFRSGERLYGRAEGLLAAALVVASPFAMLLSASGLNHVAAGAAATGALWAALGDGSAEQRSGGRDRSSGRAFACGLACGALATIRPLDGAVVFACVAPLVVGRIGWRGLAGLAAGALPPLALLGLYDLASTGSALRPGYSFVWGSDHGPGFHLSPWGEPHTLGRGLSFAHADLWLLNAQVFGRALPLLCAAALPLLLSDPPSMRAAGEGRARSRGEAALYGVFLGIPAAYLLYWHHDWFLGPRYAFTAFPFFTLLAARGSILALRRLEGISRRPDPSPMRARAVPGVSSSGRVAGDGTSTSHPTLGRAALAGALVAGGAWLLAVDLPGRLGPAFALRPDFRVDVLREARSNGIRRGVVFVKESWGSRLLARSLGLGLSPAEAERAYRSSDHCALEILLDAPGAGRERILAGLAADLRRRPPPRPDPSRNGDPTLRLRAGERIPPACRDEIAYDLAAPFGSFTPQMSFQDPWLRGPLVVARDLRDEDRALVAALHRGPGYLYVPGRRGARGVFLPLGSGEGPRF